MRVSPVRYGSRFFFGLASQATAMVEAADGNWTESFAALDRAERSFAAIPHSYEVARTCLFRAYLHVQRHKPQDLGAAGEVLEEPIGVNKTGLFNIRLTFKIKRKSLR